MRTFSGSLLERAKSAPYADIETLTGSGSVMVLAPHPDDESLGCGAAIRDATGNGYPVTVVVVTDGRHSHRGSKVWPPHRVARQRRREVEAATTILTGTTLGLVWLGLEDGGAPTDERAIAPVADDLADLCARRGITAVWSSWNRDPHIDHQNTALLAQAVVARRCEMIWQSYPIWGRFEQLDDSELPPLSAIRLYDSAGQADVKAAAVAAHRSQMTPLIDDDPDGFVMDSDMQAHFINAPEIFIRESPR